MLGLAKMRRDGFTPLGRSTSLNLVASKKVSGKCDPSKVYVNCGRDTWAAASFKCNTKATTHLLLDTKGRADSYMAGTNEPLEKNGVIKTKKIGNQKYKYVLLIHQPRLSKTAAAGNVDDDWLDTYKDRQLETKELTFNARKKAGLLQKLSP